MSAEIRGLAKRIAVDLFRNGSGTIADRLVLTRSGLDHGGWSEGAASDRIEMALTEYYQTQESSLKRQLNALVEVCTEIRLMGQPWRELKCLECGIESRDRNIRSSIALPQAGSPCVWHRMAAILDEMRGSDDKEGR